MEETTEYTKHQHIEFNCYGTIVVGKFLCYLQDNINIEVISDTSGATEEGEEVFIHKSHPNKAITI